MQALNTLPVDEFVWPGLALADVRLHVWRLDLNHPQCSGNKLYKLEPWLQRARHENRTPVTCGGAWSNHLYALAAAAYQLGMPSVGLVRGLEEDRLTPTLQDCRQWGMRLIPVDRNIYRHRYSADFMQRFAAQLPANSLWIPEGGSDETAVSACEAIGNMLNPLLLQYACDAVFVGAGSGGTVAGIARTLSSSATLYAVPVMHETDALKQHVRSLAGETAYARISWLEGAAYAGFGRYRRADRVFHERLEQCSGIPFDPVYTAKVMRRLIEGLENGSLHYRRPLMIHTGGLQGRRSLAP